MSAAVILGSVLRATGHTIGLQSAPPPSFEQVYESHFEFVWRTLRRLGVPDAALDDIVQDVFIVVYRRLQNFRGESSLKTWLFGILLRVLATHRRTAQRRATEPLGDREPLSHAPSPAAQVERAQARALLMQLLDALDEDRRIIFVSVEIEQMSCPDVAEALGVNLNTVYSRLRAARRDFEAVLSRHRAREQGKP